MRHIRLHHRRQAWPVHVRVEDADRGALFPQAEGEIDGDGGLADAAFAATDSQDLVDTRQASRPLGLLLLGCFFLWRHLDFDFADPG